MAIIRGMGSNSLTNQPTCGGNIKGGLAPVTNNSANVNRIFGGPTRHGTKGFSPVTGSVQHVPTSCVLKSNATSAEKATHKKWFPTYCCPVGVGQIYNRIGMGKYNM